MTQYSARSRRSCRLESRLSRSSILMVSQAQVTSWLHGVDARMECHDPTGGRCTFVVVNH